MTSSPAVRRLLPITEVAQRVCKSTRNIRELAARDQFLEPTRLGRSVRWDAVVLDAWIDAGCPTPVSDWIAARRETKPASRSSRGE